MIHITDKSKCTGCHACAAVCPKNCISMQTDAEGFWYPVVEEKDCIHCGACVQVCPILSPLENEKTAEDITACAVIHKEDAVRAVSSSGGVFTAIASHIIRQGGVVFGAAFTENFQVEHRYTETLEGLQDFRGSKYVQSRIGDAYRQAEAFLKAGRWVLFSGTPCQIEGLLAYLKQDHDHLLTQDIICHGVPSPMVWDRYVRDLENKAGSKICSVSFRDKQESWKKYAVSIGFENRTTYTMPAGKDLYMRAFLGNLSLRPSCHSCAFKKKVRCSDFTLSDFWGVEQIAPELQDDRGISLVFVNSERGMKVLQQIEDSVTIKKVDMEAVIPFNMSMVQAAKPSPKREAFLKAVQTEDFDRVKKAFLEPSAAQVLIRKGKGLLKKLLKLAEK